MCGQCGTIGTDCGCESITLPYIKGRDGQSNYQLWLSLGNTGTLADFFEAMRGAAGDDGRTAYEVALENGFVGTEAQWLASLVGDSAYEIAVAGGFVGTVEEWIASLSGTNGLTPLYTLAAAFTMPAFDGLGIALLTEHPSLALLGQPYYLEGAGTLRVSGIPGPNQIQLMNPNITWDLNVVGEPSLSGVPGNAAAGTVIPAGARMTPGGRPGRRGNQGPDGTSIPGDTGTPGTDGIDGSVIMFLNADPNTQPSSYGNVGDVVYDTSVIGQQTIWQKDTPTTWGNRGVILGAAVPAVSAQSFRVGKVAPQPIPTGSSAPMLLQFEQSSGSGLYNGGWWNGSTYDGQTGITTPMRFTLENLRIYRTGGSGEVIDFDVIIDVNGVTTVSSIVGVTVPDTEGLLPVLTTGPIAVSASSLVRVFIKPSGSPTNQWYVDAANVVFYNQA